MSELLSPEQIRQELIGYYEDKITRVEPIHSSLHQLRDEIMQDKYLTDEDKSFLKHKLIRTWFSIVSGKPALWLVSDNNAARA